MNTPFIQAKSIVKYLICTLHIFILSSCATTAPKQLQSDSPEVLYQQGAAHYQAGEVNAAKQVFSKILELDSSYAAAYRGLSAIAFDQGNFKESSVLLREYINLNSEVEPIVWHRLGLTGWEVQNFEQAIEGFENYLNNAPANSRLIQESEKYLRDSRYLNKLTTSIPRNDKPLSTAINTPAAEYLPSLPADGTRMIFTRRVRGQEDFFEAQKVNGVWQTAEPITELNTSENEGAHFLSADGRTLLFTRCGVRDDYGSCDIYFTTTDGQHWKTPRNLGPEVNTKAWESQPCLSADGRRLFFSSNRAGGKGGRDIWYVDRTPDGWSAAINLDIINTTGDEESPYLHPDGHSLYLMSNGHPGHGGYDLFYVDLTGEAQAINLGGSINTRDDEGAMSISLDGQTGYFARTITDDPAHLNIDIFETSLARHVRSSPTMYVEIEVFDAISNQRLATTAVIYDLEKDNSFSPYAISAAGQNLVTLPSGNDYGLRIDKEGYTFYSEHIDLSEAGSLLDPLQLHISLRPLSDLPDAPEPIILRNIFYASGSAELLEASFVELDFLKKKMDKNTEMKIVIQGHTDDVGSPIDNLQLSEARARSVFDYLVAAGVEATRMKSQGFGEDRPLVSNASEEGRRQNRRTEFVIVDSL